MRRGRRRRRAGFGRGCRLHGGGRERPIPAPEHPAERIVKWSLWQWVIRGSPIFGSSRYSGSGHATEAAAAMNQNFLSQSAPKPHSHFRAFRVFRSFFYPLAVPTLTTRAVEVAAAADFEAVPVAGRIFSGGFRWPEHRAVSQRENRKLQTSRASLTAPQLLGLLGDSLPSPTRVHPFLIKAASETSLAKMVSGADSMT